MLRTRLTEQYGLDTPFVSAGMGFLALPELVAAVSNAGGLGLLGAVPQFPPAVQQMIRKTRSLTTRPFGVDFVVENAAFGPLCTEEHMDVCIAEQVRIVVFFWNLPPAAWIERLHNSGAKVWLQAGTLERAEEAVASGVDAVIIQGTEAGGHNQGAAGLFTLLPAVRDAIPSIPVIAAGGISDGRGVAAALALGADGVCVGTRLIASDEAYAHAEYKRRIIAAQAGDTTLTRLFGPEWPNARMRVLRNRVVNEWSGRDEKTPSQPDPPQFIGNTRLLGQDYPMPKFSSVLPTPETSGDFEEMCIAAGEGAALVRDIKPAAEIVREMMAEAERILSEHLPRRAKP